MKGSVILRVLGNSLLKVLLGLLTCHFGIVQPVDFDLFNVVGNDIGIVAD